jgi:membrane-bound metal-dependent hydrolase YbcI (DUF457 family)
LELIIHFTIPFIALTLLGLDVKRALPLSLLALLPDLDALFLVHRSLSHSLVVVFAFAAPIVMTDCKGNRDYAINEVNNLIESRVRMGESQEYRQLFVPITWRNG